MNRIFEHWGFRVRQEPPDSGQGAGNDGTEDESSEDETSPGPAVGDGPLSISLSSSPASSTESSSDSSSNSTASSLSSSEASASSSTSTFSDVELTTSTTPTPAATTSTTLISSTSSKDTSVSSSVRSSSFSSPSSSPSAGTSTSASATFTTTGTGTTPTLSSAASGGTFTAGFVAGPGTGAGTMTQTGTIPVDSGPSPSETSAPAATGAMSVGAVAGTISGVLVGIALLGAAIVFYMRRRRSRRATHHFDAASFRRSAMIVDDERTKTPELFQFRPGHQSVSSSINGPGMAGHGAYAYRQAQEQRQPYQPYHQPKNSIEYYTDAFAQQFHDEQQMQQLQAVGPSGAVPAQRQPIQPRQQHTFGQTSNATEARNITSDDGHDDPAGAYSSRPVPQAAYNIEAYANYAYSPNVDQSGQAYVYATKQRTVSTAGEGGNPYGGI
ncbi:hypothetical protein Moror_11611 [Moniliophthora roreri MCA 2997]|uniref:Uncharacterized protein n=2 Tax=Moniliophthora roreri TaxID=221103 RepID=V2WKS3_MONRO|nr:hypothetical protein Moror_11611 [Moniliophthora roreri MCA 2997]KAI3616743.1 hypothetical protein WG66_004193 [Moniliophthora roreri]